MAQVAPAYPGTVAYAETPSAALARNIRLLAVAPRSYEALIGAGRAALALGDSQAAIGFFGRAEEVSPRSPAPKAGTAAALVAMEEPVQALGYFAEAMRLGATQSSIGADRGLAYDLTGEPRLAQADYRAAMYGPDGNEARRRLALSLAMGKDRAGALAAIAPLMGRRDPATERVRAFVLAMVGDVDGARRVVEATMPGSAAIMAPFLYKLARMSPDQQVAAVHFGRFPDDSAIKLAAVNPPPIMTSPPVAAKPVEKKSVAPPAALKRAAPSKASNPGWDEIGRVYSIPDPPVRRTVRQPAVTAPPAKPVAAIAVPSVASNLTPAPIQAPPAAIAIAPAQSPPAQIDAPAQTVSTSPEIGSEPQLQPQPPPVEVSTAASTPAVDRLSDIDSLLKSPDEPIVEIPTNTSSDEAAEATAPPPSKSKPETAAEKKAAAKKDKGTLDAAVEEALASSKSSKKSKSAKPEPKAAKSPGKYWVQLAGGSKTERMPIEYKRIKGKKPALFAKRTAYVAELKGWTRLLVGPFKSEDDAQEYVNQLAKADIDGFSWTSPSGQAIEKLPPK